MGRAHANALDKVDIIQNVILSAQEQWQPYYRSLQFSTDDQDFTPAPDIPPMGMVVAAIPVVIATLVSLYLRLGNVTTLLIASTRCVGQLMILGLLLYPIFINNQAYVVLPYIFIMILFATREASVKPKHRYKAMPLHMLLAITLATSLSFAVISGLVLKPTPWWDASVMIPVCGMLLGSCVNSLSLGIDRLLLSLDDSARLQTFIACGATKWEASLPSIREAMETGMTPNLNQMSVMGLVAIPGMMTGQILGGTPPFVAAKYQIVIMFFICSNGIFVLLGVITQAVFWSLFDAQHLFRGNAVSTRTGGKPKDIVLVVASGLVALFRSARTRMGTTKREHDGSIELPEQVNNEEEDEVLDTNHREPTKCGTFRLDPEAGQFAAPASNLLLSLSGASIAYGDQFRLSSLSLGLRKGEIMLLTGPSGCGKSSFLRALALMEPMEHGGGSLRLQGQEVDELGSPVAWRTQVCYVRQQGGEGLRGTPKGLLADICALSSQSHRLQARAQKEAAAAEIRLAKSMDALGLPLEMLDRRWDLMSGGESQRVYLCVLLALQPLVVLLDEPTSACDKPSALKVEELLLDSGIAMVWVTHDPTQMERLENCSKAFVMEYQRLNGDGEAIEAISDEQAALGEIETVTNYNG